MGWTNASRSQSFDHLFRPETLRTVMAAGFFSTMITSRLAVCAGARIETDAARADPGTHRKQALI